MFVTRDFQIFYVFECFSTTQYNRLGSSSRVREWSIIHSYINWVDCVQVLLNTLRMGNSFLNFSLLEKSHLRGVFSYIIIFGRLQAGSWSLYSMISKLNKLSKALPQWGFAARKSTVSGFDPCKGRMQLQHPPPPFSPLLFLEKRKKKSTPPKKKEKALDFCHVLHSPFHDPVSLENSGKRHWRCPAVPGGSLAEAESSPPSLKDFVVSI